MTKGYTNRRCDACPTRYNAKKSDLKRGWGLTCSKSCAAIKRERKKFARKLKGNEEGVDLCESDHPFSSDALGQW